MLNLNKDIILIPAKGVSKRCPNKNLILLQWVVKYLKHNIERAVLITDSDVLINKATEYGLKYYKSNITDCELHAMLDYLNTIQYNRKYFIYLPLTQPLRELDLINTIDNINSDKDFIVSCNNYINREIFNIKNNKFIVDSIERKGCMCEHLSSIDGAIYKINTLFLNNAINSKNINSYFWSGNFDTISNNMPFLDIDEIADLNSFYNLLYLFNTYIENPGQ